MGAVRTSRQAAPAPPETLRGEIESFLASCRRPALMEPGFAPLALAGGCYALTVRGAALTLEAWDGTRTFARRLLRIVERKGGRLHAAAERFGRGAALVTLFDLEDARAAPALRRNQQQTLAERLRAMLARQYPGWRVEELTSGADLVHSLSPAHPRALISRRGRSLAAICAAPGDAGRALTFGLIWLAYVRRRGAARRAHGLALFLPRGEEEDTRVRLRHLNPDKASFDLFVYDPDGGEQPVNLEDTGNLFAKLEPWRAADPPGATEAAQWARRLALEPGVEAVEMGGGVRSLRVAGLEFARLAGRELWAGLGRKRRARSLEEPLGLARRLAAVRLDPDAPRTHAWVRQAPEARLESLVRANLAALDPLLLPEPVYGQVCALAGRGRGVADLLALDLHGRLAVIELKADEDPHLPLQALDYWIRVRRHAAAGEFGPAGYFPGRAVRRDAPRLLLAAPALRFHPATETLLSFFPSEVEVERIGLGVEWQRSFRVVLRVAGAARPEWPQARNGDR